MNFWGDIFSICDSFWGGRFQTFLLKDTYILGYLTYNPTFSYLELAFSGCYFCCIISELEAKVMSFK